MEPYTLPLCNTVFSDKAEFPFNVEASLPEHLPGIGRIVRAEARFTALTASLVSGGVSVSGKLNVQVLYLSDKQSTLHSTVFPASLEHTFEASKMPEPVGEAIPQASGTVLSAVARPRGARALDVRVGICLNVRVEDMGSRTLLDPDSVPEAELHACHTTAVTQKKIVYAPEAVVESITLDSDRPNASDVILHTLELSLADCHTENGRLVYAGSAVFRCTYRAEANEDADEAQYVYLTKELPFDGSVEEEELQSGMTVAVQLQPGVSEVTSTFDPYGESRVLEFSFSYTLNAEVFSETELSYFDDGYCPTFGCELEKSACATESIVGFIRSHDRIEEALRGERGLPVEITDSGAVLTALSPEISDEKLYLTGKLGVWVLGRDEKGEPICVEGVFPVRLSTDTTVVSGAERRYITDTVCIACDAVLRDGEILVRVETETSGLCLEKHRFAAIDRAVLHYDEPKPLCKAEYIVYYPDPEETLWDIAKKYEVSRDLLRAANGMSGDELPGRTVVIPC